MLCPVLTYWAVAGSKPFCMQGSYSTATPTPISPNLLCLAERWRVVGLTDQVGKLRHGKCRSLERWSRPLLVNQ